MNIETRIQTFSIVAGSEACNARCPFCVSKMTPDYGMTLGVPEVDWKRFDKACQYAIEGRTNTAMITGKGEPTLFPDQITQYLQNLLNNESTLGFNIQNKEIQSNGIAIAQKPEEYAKFLRDWRELGLTTASLSVVHFDSGMNRKIYMPYAKEYIDLEQVVIDIHSSGVAVRLACILVDGFIDDSKKLEQLIEFTKKNNIEQLTLRPVNKPTDSRNKETYDWTSAHHLKPYQMRDIGEFVERKGTYVRSLPFGATIYDVDGLSVCLTNSLTANNDEDYLRQLIFFPNGVIATDWIKENNLA